MWTQSRFFTLFLVVYILFYHVTIDWKNIQGSNNKISKNNLNTIHVDQNIFASSWFYQDVLMIEPSCADGARTQKPDWIDLFQFYQDAEDLCWDSYLHGSRRYLLLQHLTQLLDLAEPRSPTRRPDSVQNRSSTIMKRKVEGDDVEEGQRTIMRKALEKRKTQQERGHTMLATMGATTWRQLPPVKLVVEAENNRNII